MKRLKSMSFRIAAAVGAMVLIILSIIFFVVRYQVSRFMMESIESSSLQIAEARADEIDAIVEGYQQSLKTLAGLDTFVRGTRAEVQAYADSFAGKVGFDIASVYVAWPDGGAVFRGNAFNVSDRRYYEAIFQEGQDSFVGNPIVSRSSGIPAVILAQAIKDPQGRTKAILAFEMSLEQVSKAVSEIEVGAMSYGWVLDSTGLVIASPDPDAIMKVNVNQGDEAHGYKGLSAIAGEILSQEQATGIFRDPAGMEYTIFSSEISEVYSWRMAILAANRELQAPLNRLNLYLFFIMIGALIIALFEAALIGNWIAQPIGQLASHFQELAEGDADLTKHLAMSKMRTNEIDTLVSDFNRFLDKLSGIIGEMKSAQGEIKSSGLKLSRQAQDSSSEIDRIANLINSIQEQLEEQKRDIDNSSVAVNQTSQSIGRLDSLIVEQASSISEASASIEEMVSNIGSVSASTERIASEFRQLMDSSERGLQIQHAAREKITEISEQSNSLMEANTAIGVIAAQTNLLAMNAAIEAAHAGEAGKGFSVVADEIRRLAETSSAQSKTIGANLTSIQETIVAVVKASENSENSFQDLNEKISSADTLVSEVKSAMEEQKEGSQQILVAIKSMNEITSSVRESSGDMSEGNKVIVSAVDTLAVASENIHANSQEIFTGINTVEFLSKEIANIASQNEDLVQRMEENIGRFKV